MAPHSSTFAWKIPWMEEPGRLQSMGFWSGVPLPSPFIFEWRAFQLHGNLLQCSCLENPRDGGAQWAAIYGVAQSRTRLKRLSSSSIPLNIFSVTTSHHVKCCIRFFNLVSKFQYSYPFRCFYQFNLMILYLNITGIFFMFTIYMTPAWKEAGNIVACFISV